MLHFQYSDSDSDLLFLASNQKEYSHLDLGQVVDWLLTHGADPQLADRAGDTALHYAVLGARWVASQSEASCWSRDLSSDQ